MLKTKKIKTSKLIPEKIKVSKLKRNPDNPRIMRDDEYLILLNSVKTSPWMLEINSIKIDKDFTVLSGNQRLKACRELKMKEVFVTNIGHLTKEQQKEYIIKDNEHAGEYDFAKLNEWPQDKLKEWGVYTWQPTEEKYEDFFEDKDDQEQTHKIVLEYNEENYNVIIEKLGQISGTKEAIIYNLLTK